MCSVATKVLCTGERQHKKVGFHLVFLRLSARLLHLLLFFAQFKSWKRRKSRNDDCPYLLDGSFPFPYLSHTYTQTYRNNKSLNLSLLHTPPCLIPYTAATVALPYFTHHQPPTSSLATKVSTSSPTTTHTTSHHHNTYVCLPHLYIHTIHTTQHKHTDHNKTHTSNATKTLSYCSPAWSSGRQCLCFYYPCSCLTWPQGMCSTCIYIRWWYL